MRHPEPGRPRGSPSGLGGDSGFFLRLPGRPGPVAHSEATGPPALAVASGGCRLQPLDEPHRLRGDPQTSRGLCRSSALKSSTGTSGAQGDSRGFSAARKNEERFQIWRNTGFSDLPARERHPLVKKGLLKSSFSPLDRGSFTPQQVSSLPLLLGLQIRAVWTRLLAWTTQLVGSQAPSGGLTWPPGLLCRRGQDGAGPGLAVVQLTGVVGRSMVLPCPLPYIKRRGWSSALRACLPLASRSVHRPASDTSVLPRAECIGLGRVLRYRQCVM